MLKKLFTVAFAILVSVSIFVGCSLVGTNSAAYYNQVVAEVVLRDYTKTFTMKDLLNAYSSYGNQYAQNGQATKETIMQTLNTMVDRAILIEELKRMPELELTDAEIQELKRETYKNINESLQEIEKEIRKEWKIEVEETPEDEEQKSPLRTAYTPFEPNFEVVNGELKRIVKPTTIDPTPAGEFVQAVTDVKVSAEALKRYYNQLKRSAEIEGIKNLSNEQLLQREIDRIYGILEDNKYISKYQEDFNNNNPVNTQAVVDRYNFLYTRDHFTYTNNMSAYYNQMKSDSSKVYYHPVEGKFLNVTHILIKFSSEQNENLANYKKMLDANEISESDYEYLVELEKNKTFVKYEDEEGNVLTKHVAQVYNEVENAVYSIGNWGSKTLTETQLRLRAKAFNEFIYKYNDDPGIMNKDFSYVVNLTDETDNNMIEEFTNASRELHTNENKGTGTISELVFAEFSQGEYGFHIILNLGPTKNLVNVANIQNLNVSWQLLFNTYTQPSSDKTMFDVLYSEAVSESGAASQSLSNIVSTAKNTIKEFKIHESRFENLWK